MRLGPETPALVTGGASGLGAATARALAAAGAPVALLDRDRDRGEATAREIGGVFCAADVTDASSLDAAIGAAADAQGVARICVCCAGVAPAAKTVSRGAPHDPDLFARVIGVNLIGSFLAASRAAAAMAVAKPCGPDAERGVIVLTASVAAFEGQVGQAAYAASKGGVAALALPMARDLADKGVRVAAIAPGLFATPMLAGLPEDVQASLGAQAPYPPRLGDPSEFAALARHIIENPMINGTTLRLDAALRMGPR